VKKLFATIVLLSGLLFNPVSLFLITASAQVSDCPGEWAEEFFTIQLAFRDVIQSVTPDVEADALTDMMLTSQDLTSQLLDMSLPPCAEPLRQSLLRVFTDNNNMFFSIVAMKAGYLTRDEFLARARLADTRITSEYEIYRLLVQEYMEGNQQSG